MFNTKMLVIAVVVVIIAAVGLLSTNTWNPSWNPFHEPFEGKLVESSIAKLFGSEFFRAEMNLTADILANTSQGVQRGEITLTIDADFDLSDEKSMKNAADIDITISTEGVEFSAGLQTIATADGFYFNLKSAPAFLPLPVDLSAIKGQWFGLDKDLLRDMLIGAGEETFEINDEVQATKQFMKELSGLLSDKEIFSVEKSLGAEKVGNENAEHYLVSLRKEAVKQIVPELFELVKKYIPAEQMTEYQQDIEQSMVDFPQKVDLAWQGMGGIEFDVWIDNGILRKIQWEKEINLSDVQDLTNAQDFTTEVTGGNVDMLLEIVFSDFGKKFNIKPPASYKPFEEIITMLGGSFVDPTGDSLDSMDSFDFLPDDLLPEFVE